MRNVIYSFDHSEFLLKGLRNRAVEGDKEARRMITFYSNQYRRDLRAGRQERPFSIA